MNFLELTATEGGKLYPITFNALYVGMCVPKGDGCIVKMTWGIEYRVTESYGWVRQRLNTAITITGSVLT